MHKVAPIYLCTTTGLIKHCVFESMDWQSRSNPLASTLIRLQPTELLFLETFQELCFRCRVIAFDWSAYLINGHKKYSWKFWTLCSTLQSALFMLMYPHYKKYSILFPSCKIFCNNCIHNFTSLLWFRLNSLISEVK